MTSKVIISAVPGQVPTGKHLGTHRFGINTADAKLYVFDGAEVVDIIDVVEQDYTTLITQLEADLRGDIAANLWMTHARGQAEMNALRKEVISQRAASGFDDYGMQRDTGGVSGDPINEGMWARASIDFKDRLAMGYPAKGAQAAGTSKVDFPVTTIAGIVFNLLYVNQSNDGYGYTNIKVPAAERGTRIFSKVGNARDTARWYLDFRHDIDPKYGDVATTDSEAASRAFEGVVTNGDFRNGNDGAWTSGVGDGNTITISEGSCVITKVGAHWSYIQQEDRLIVGEEYVMEFWSDEGTGQLYVQGGNYLFVRKGWNRMRFTADSTIASFQVVGNATYTIRNLSFRLASEEVVVARHDIVGAEYFLEEVSLDNPYVYPHGMIQSKATTMNGVTAVRSNRPGTYYSVYSGDLINPPAQISIPVDQNYTAVGGYTVLSSSIYTTDDNVAGGAWQSIPELVAGKEYILKFSIAANSATNPINMSLHNSNGVVTADPLVEFTVGPGATNLSRILKFTADSVDGLGLYWHMDGDVGGCSIIVQGVYLTEVDPATDSESAGLGVDFWAASDQEKINIVSDHSNNIFLLPDGRVVQWRMRQRTYKGYGNGDWYNTDSTGDAVGFQTAPYLQPAVQGIADKANDTFVFGEDVGGWYGLTNTTPISTDPGVFKAGLGGVSIEAAGVNGECYFQVWARVPRLNIGAYHPSHNPRGTSQTIRADETGWTTWESEVGADNRGPVSCFQDYRVNIDGLINTNDPVGSIDVGLSGRRDGRFFDSIYAGGFGGVNDDRLPSWDGQEVVERAYGKAVDGSFRGQERQQYWRVNRNVYPDSSSSVIYLHRAMGTPTRDDIAGGGYVNPGYNTRGRKAWVKIVEAGGATLTSGTQVGVWYECDIICHPQYKHMLLNPNTGTSRWIDSGNSNTLKLDIACAVFVDENNNSHTVSGMKNQIDVIGSPQDVSGRYDLTAGWEGNWIGPSRGTSAYNWLSRYEYTNNMGADAMIVLQPGGTTYYTRPIDQTRNRVTSVGTNGDVGVLDYNTQAYILEDFATRKYSIGDTMLDHVYATSHNNPERGGALREAFLNVTDTAYGANHPHSEYRGLRRKTLLSSRLNASSGTREYDPVHSQVALGQPTYGNQAMKMVYHPFSTNRKVGLNFVMNELQWIGSYADIGVVDINDSNPSLDGVAGQIYRTQGTWSGITNYKLLKCLNAFAASWNDPSWLVSGVDGEGRSIIKYGTNPSGTPYMREFGTQGDYWGDTGSIYVPDLGVEVFDDEFGETRMAAQMILSKPIGFITNKARVGTQLNGVDV